MAVITNETMLAVAEQIDRRNAILQRFVNEYSPTTWLSIQADIRAGKAKQKYAIGDELIGTYTYNNVSYECPWVVLDNDRECEWEDGTKHPALYIGMKYATPESITFDAPEATTVDLTEEPNALSGWYYWGLTGTTYTALNLSAGASIPTTYGSVVKCAINSLDVVKYGYNRWSHSAQRQWLNSDAAVGEWWSAKHTGDLPPSQLNSYKGFMVGFPSDFLSVLHPVKVKTSCNTVTDGGVTDTTIDTFFLQSLEEVYGAPQISDIEGPYFPYWKVATQLTEPSNGSSSNTNNARKIKRLDNLSGSAVYVRLRSTYRSVAYYVWSITSAGYLSSSNASHSYASLPACVIC